ncbi:hypothetical protein EDD22DRAFT_855142, partial [Suillus occidentalis]
FTYYGDTKRVRIPGKHAASSLEPIPLSPDDIKTMKDSAHKDMVQRVFEMGLFPTADEITRAANAALDTVIGSNASVNLRRWKTMQQGRLFIGRLKGIVKTSQSTRLGNLVHNASSFDVTICSMENGVFKLVQAPLVHPSVTALLDDMLILGNWQACLEHAFAFSAAICCEELRKFANTGWINAAADDFSMSGVEAAYNEFVDHISSLVGDPKVIFDLMLSRVKTYKDNQALSDRSRCIIVVPRTQQARKVAMMMLNTMSLSFSDAKRGALRYVNACNEEQLRQDQSVNNIQLLVMTQAQQLQDSQDRIDSLHVQLFHLRERLYDVECARNIVERHVEALQTLKSGGKRCENSHSPLAKRKSLMQEYYPDGGQSIRWLMDEEFSPYNDLSTEDSEGSLADTRPVAGPWASKDARDADDEPSSPAHRRVDGTPEV